MAAARLAAEAASMRIGMTIYLLPLLNPVAPFGERGKRPRMGLYVDDPRTGNVLARATCLNQDCLTGSRAGSISTDVIPAAIHSKEDT